MWCVWTYSTEMDTLNSLINCSNQWFWWKGSVTALSPRSLASPQPPPLAWLGFVNYHFLWTSLVNSMTWCQQNSKLGIKSYSSSSKVPFVIQNAHLQPINCGTLGGFVVYPVWKADFRCAVFLSVELRLQGYTQHIWLMAQRPEHAHANHFSDWLCCFRALIASLAGTVVAALAMSLFFSPSCFNFAFFFYLQSRLRWVLFKSNGPWLTVKRMLHVCWRALNTFSLSSLSLLFCGSSWKSLLSSLEMRRVNNRNDQSKIS